MYLKQKVSVTLVEKKSLVLQKPVKLWEIFIILAALYAVLAAGLCEAKLSIMSTEKFIAKKIIWYVII